MGLNFSSRRDLYLRKCTPPKRTERSERFAVRLCANQAGQLVCTQENPFAHLGSDVDVRQKSVILGIYSLFVFNEAHESLEVSIKGLFDLNKVRPNQDKPHPDDTASITVVCPPKFNGPVEVTNRKQYAPRVSPEEIKMYAGMEKAILEPTTVSLQQEDEQILEVFEATNPIVTFMDEHAKDLGTLDVEKFDTGYRRIGNDSLERIRQFFSNTIFDMMRYTRFEDCSVSCDTKCAPGTSVTVILQVDFLVVEDTGNMQLEEIQL